MGRTPVIEALKTKFRMSAHSYGSIAKELGVSRAAIANFISGRRHKCGRAAALKIRLFLIERSLLPAPKRRPRCICPICGKNHTLAKGPQFHARHFGTEE